MSKPKIIIAALILALGLTGAYFIVSGRGSEPIENALEEIIGNNPVGIEPVTASSTQNLTNILTQKIAEGITSQNKEGFITSNSGETLISAPEPEKMISELIAEAQKNFDPESLRPQIKDSFIKISEDNSKASLSAYFLSFNSILSEAGKNIPETLYNENELSISDFAKAEAVYGGAINKFYDLTVPRMLLGIDKKEIELLTVKKNIFGKMANAEQDPMTAFLASNELLKIDQEFATLKTEIDKFIKANPIN